MLSECTSLLFNIPHSLGIHEFLKSRILRKGEEINIKIFFYWQRIENFFSDWRHHNNLVRIVHNDSFDLIVPEGRRTRL